jgi:hypothetical protein
MNELLYEGALEVRDSSGPEDGLRVEISPEDGVSNQKVDEIKTALREQAQPDDVATEE